MNTQDEAGRLPHTLVGVVLAIFAGLLAVGGCTRGDEPAQGAGAQAEAHTAGGLEGLRAQTQSLVAQLRLPATSSTDLDAQARRLVAAALPVAGEIAREHAECVEHITLVLDGARLMDALSADQLERTWYHDGSVPSAPALCQHAQDLVVRPVRTVAMLGEGELSDVRVTLLAEMQALLEDIATLERRR